MPVRNDPPYLSGLPVTPQPPGGPMAREVLACAVLAHILAAQGCSVSGLAPFQVDDALDDLVALMDRLSLHSSDS